MFSIVVRVWLWFSTILSELTSSGVWNINKRLYFYERKSNSGTDGCIHISFEAPGGPFEMQLLSPCSVWPKTQPATKQIPKAEEKAASRNQKQLKVLEHQKNFKGGLPFPFSRLSQYFFFRWRWLFLLHQISPLFVAFSDGFLLLGAVFNLIWKCLKRAILLSLPLPFYASEVTLWQAHVCRTISWVGGEG